MKISFIVPVFNSEGSLSKCIGSILQQSFRDFELILVDDGSTDDSLGICKLYSKQDKRVKCIHTKNYGVSHARNIGLKKASGEWIAFVDADDYVDREYISSFLPFLKNNRDIVFCDYKSVSKFGIKSVYYSHQNISFNDTSKLKIQIINKKSFELTNSKSLLLGSATCKMFNKSFLKKNHICFNEKLKYSEDRIFMIDVFDHAKQCAYMNKCLYYYHYAGVESAGRKFDENFFRYINEYLSLLNTKQYFGSCLNVLPSELCRVVHLSFKKNFLNDYGIDFNEKKQQFLGFLSKTSCSVILRNIDYDTLTFVECIYAFCIAHRMFFILYVIEFLFNLF